MKICSLFLFILIISEISANANNLYTDYVAYPKNFNLNYDSLNIMTTDGLRLTGWFIKAEHPDSAYTMFITTGANMSYSLPMANACVSMENMNVVVFDHRGWGTSDSFPIDTNMLAYPEYLTDINSTIDWCKSHLKIDTSKIIMYGFSMGASLSICAACQRNDIKILIADSPYANQKETGAQLNEKYSLNLKFIPNDKLEPENVIGNIKNTRVIFLANLGDPNVPYDNSIRLYQKCTSEKKTIWITPYKGHGDAIPSDTRPFFDILRIMSN